MSQFEQLALQRTNDFTTYGTAGLWTKYSGTFDGTQTSMYAEVVGLAGSTGYGGASLGNQTERYLMATTSIELPSTYDVFTSFDANDMSGNSKSINTYMSDSANWTLDPTGHDNFTSLQSSLEDDGQHFVTYTHTSGGYKRFILLIDKQNLGSGSGSSSSSGTSDYAINHTQSYGSNPNTSIDTLVNATDSINSSITTAFNKIKNKIEAQSTHSKDDLLLQYFIEKENQPHNLTKLYDFIERKV